VKGWGAWASNNKAWEGGGFAVHTSVYSKGTYPKSEAKPASFAQVTLYSRYQRVQAQRAPMEKAESSWPQHHNRTGLVQPVPHRNDRLCDDEDVPHLTIGWVNGRPGILGIGGGVNENGVGRVADAVTGQDEG
jgi:hypothetical protein